MMYMNPEELCHAHHCLYLFTIYVHRREGRERGGGGGRGADPENEDESYRNVLCPLLCECIACVSL